MRTICALAIGAVLGLAPQFALAGCPAGNIVFSDEFTDESGGWEADRMVSYAEGSAILKVPAGSSFRSELNASFLVRDANICVDAVSPPDPRFGGSDKLGGGGLVFWASSYQNYYAFQVYGTGDYGLYRNLNGQWINIISATPSPAVKKGPGAVNRLEVTLKGNTVTLAVNGTQLAVRQAMAPQTDLRFGFCAMTEDKVGPEGSPEFGFKRFMVSVVP